MRKKNVLVVTHDAGGSEIIAAYVKRYRNIYRFRVYTNGPGARVFRRLHIPFSRIRNDRKEIRNIIEKNRDCTYALLALPGWMTRIEITALEEARRAGLRTAVYLEDWRMYRERFGYPKRNWYQCLPDQLWAGDKAAYVLAKKQFKGLPVGIRNVPNEFFRSAVKRYRGQRKRRDSILFISSAWGSEKVLADLLKYLAKSYLHASVRIRLHPADDHARYDSIIRKYRGVVGIEKSTREDIAKDLTRARVVIGTQTVVLPLSALCGIPTFEVKTRGRSARTHTTTSWTKNLRPAPTFSGVIAAKSVRTVFPHITRQYKRERV